MDCDLLMYLRAARSMAAFVGWCDGGSTDDGCAAASMDETTINALHTLHQNNYDTGRALQAFVKIINPKSVDKRWPDEDTKKFVRGLKQHGKNFFKIRKELLPYKDTANLVEYYYLWKKTPAASTTRPHRRHRRPAFRRQAPTPTLPAGDEMEDMSSASEASEMESEEDCNQSTATATNSHDMTSSCGRCSTTKSSRWYEINKDMVVCADCHHNSEAMIGQVDEEVPPNCELIGGAEDEMTRVGADEDAPPFMFRPVKEESEKMAIDEAATNESKINMPASLPTKSETDQVVEDIKVPIASPVDTKENVTTSAVNCTKEEVVIKDESDDTKKGFRSLMMSNDGNSSPAQKKVLEQVVKSEKMDITQQDEPIENHKWFGFSNNFPPSSAFSSQPSPFNFPPVVPSVTPVSSTGVAVSSSLFDVKPQRAVASVAPTFQDVPPPTSMINQQPTIPSFHPPSSPMIPASSSLQQNSFRPSSPRSLCPSRLLGSSSGSSSFSSSYIQSAIYAPHSSSSLSSSATSYLPTPSSSSSYLPSSYLPHIPPPSSYPPIPIQPSCSSSCSSSSSTLPEDMTTRNRREPTPTTNQDRSGGGSNNSIMGKTQPTQQPLICHNISDDDDDDDDCNIMRSPSPDVLPCNEQVYSSSNSIFMKKWNRGFNSCSRCDLEFVPTKNSEWAMKKDERLMQKNSSSSSSSHHHHNHHKSQHNKSSSNHQSVLKDGRRTDGRKDEDKNKSPMPSRSSDAQITSSLIGASHHLPPFAGPSDRMPSRGGIFHDPTPALSQLSAYARPHIGNQRCLNYSLPPTHSMEPYVRMPAMYPPGSRDVLEDLDKHMWDRDQRDRDLRELEFLEKMKQEMELKSAAGFDRMPHLPGASVDPMWADIQRRFMTGHLAPGHIPGIFPPELMQRDRMEQLARSAGQDQLAAARDTAVMQLYQRYGNDPGLFQRHFDNLVGNKAQESVHLVYHFAKADPLASAVSQASALGGSSSGGLTSGHLPPPPSALHSIPQNHPFFPFAREHERYYMEMLSRPPYSTNPMLAQQAMNNLTAQAVAQQEAIQRQLAMERDFSGNPMLH